MNTIFSRILVGVDASAAAGEAITLGARLAREHEGKLLICHAVDTAETLGAIAASGAFIDATSIVDELKRDGERILGEAVERARAAGIDAESRLIEGEPCESILNLAQTAESSLIVIATHDRTELERMFIGSTTYGVLRGSTIPVLTVRAGLRWAAKTSRCFERIVVGIDDSEPSDAALSAVLNLPAEDRRHVFLCGVAGSAVVIGGRGYHDAVMDELREQTERVVDAAVAAASAHGVTAESHIVDGDADAALVAAARDKHADVIVLGSHGRRGLRRLFLGSVAEAVVRTATVPVLVVRSVAGLHAGAKTTRREEALV
jgi:nucleotide-binding universal stress UspA family protein